MKFSINTFAIGLIIALPTEAVELHFYPSDVIAHKESPDRDYYSLMLHNVAIYNEGDESISLTGVRIVAVNNKRATGSQFLSADELGPMAQ